MSTLSLGNPLRPTTSLPLSKILVDPVRRLEGLVPRRDSRGEVLRGLRADFSKGHLLPFRSSSTYLAPYPFLETQHQSQMPPDAQRRLLEARRRELVREADSRRRLFPSSEGFHPLFLAQRMRMAPGKPHPIAGDKTDLSWRRMIHGTRDPFVPASVQDRIVEERKRVRGPGGIPYAPGIGLLQMQPREPGPAVTLNPSRERAAAVDAKVFDAGSGSRSLLLFGAIAVAGFFLLRGRG